MISIAELRIGNWVAFQGKPVKVERLDISGEINQPGTIDKNLKVRITTDTVDPIPLNLGILLLLGFKKVDEDGKFAMTFRKAEPDSDEFEAKAMVGSSSTIVSITEPLAERPTVWVDTLHELQNWHYMIVGNELMGQYLEIDNDGDDWKYKRPNGYFL